MTLCVRRQQDAFPITYLVPEFIAGRGVIAIAAANLHEAHEAVHWIFYFNTTRLPKRSRLHLFNHPSFHGFGLEFVVGRRAR